MKTLTKSRLITLPTDHSDRLGSLCSNGGHFVMQEIWKDVKGYEGYYQVSNIGNVRSLDKNQKIELQHKKYVRNRKGQPISACKSRGYNFVCLYLNCTNKRIAVHRLVAMAFIPNPENKPCINHINSIRDDNRIENLEWCTHSENNRHAHKFGKQKLYYRERHNQAKLNWQKVNEIRSKYKKSVYTMPMLSKEYGVSIGCIQSILENKTWQ